MKPRLDVLEEPQRAALQALAGPLTARGFYLAGGTALAMRLGHRMSVDLDWFGDALADPVKLAQELRDEGIVFRTGDVGPGTLHGDVNGVRTSILRYRYPLLAPPEAAEGLAARVAALEDLAAMKLAALAQRGIRRDFVDVYVLATEFRPLRDMLDLYRRKYATEDIAHVLFALSYFDDAEGERMPDLLRPLDWEALKRDIRAWVRELGA